LTQKWVHAICDEFYGTEGIHGYGYGQDEDQGQLGAWYIMSSIGLFDVKGLTDVNPSFQVSSPLFDKVTIALPKALNRKPFVIETANNSKTNVYLQEAKLNGKDMEKLSISLQDIAKGGTVKMKVDAKPSEKWSK
jgi:putative alpha-1,2-mannosidase